MKMYEKNKFSHSKTLSFQLFQFINKLIKISFVINKISNLNETSVNN